MMRIFGLLFGIGLAVIAAAWFVGGLVATGEMQRVGNEQWPAGLGTLASVEARARPQKTSDGARRMVTLAEPLGIAFQSSTGKPDPVRKAIGDYVKAEHERSESTIGEPPAEVLTYLASHDAKIDALRDHLLQGQPIVWDLDVSKGFDAPIPYLAGHMQVMRLLTARALLRGRGNDARAWDDLHAVWRLARSLESRPEVISQLIVLAMARSVNAVAWKLPRADAAWLGEVQKTDHRRLILGAYQYEMWMMWQHGERTMDSTVVMLARPYLRWSIVNMAQQQRATAEEIAAMTACSLDGADFFARGMKAIPKWNIVARIATPTMGASWQRAFRSVAEREATANALRIAQGQPIVATSACSDGAWLFENDRLSFTLDLPKSSDSETVMPLSLVIPARATRRSI